MIGARASGERRDGSRLGHGDPRCTIALMLRFVAVAVVAALGCAAPEATAPPCASDVDCNLAVGGRCLASPLGSLQCAYPAPGCVGTGLAWGELSPDIQGQCVQPADAGEPDGMPDTSVDSTPIDASPDTPAIDAGPDAQVCPLDTDNTTLSTCTACYEAPGTPAGCKLCQVSVLGSPMLPPAIRNMRGECCRFDCCRRTTMAPPWSACQ